MKDKQETTLVRDFPNLYVDEGGEPRETFGFICGSGWYDLIYNLSSRIEPLLVKYKKEYPDSVPRASCVKEKFGGLRFYMTTTTQEIEDLIDSAEDSSRTICEDCGKPGVSTHRPGGNWLATLCSICIVDKDAAIEAAERINEGKLPLIDALTSPLDYERLGVEIFLGWVKEGIDSGHVKVPPEFI